MTPCSSATRSGGEFGIDWLRDLSRRNGFPPIIYLLSQARRRRLEEDGYSRRRARLPVARKFDHDALIAALRAAQARRGQFTRPAVRADDSVARNPVR